MKKAELALLDAVMRLRKELDETGRLRWPRCTVARGDLQVVVDELEARLRHRCSLPPSVQEALNSGDGSFRP